jgi:hypothetical protein
MESNPMGGCRAEFQLQLLCLEELRSADTWLDWNGAPPSQGSVLLEGKWEFLGPWKVHCSTLSLTSGYS